VILQDLVFFTLSILTAGLIGYLVVDLLCPRNYPRWLVWVFAPATGFGICSIIIFFFRRPKFTVEGILLAVLLFFWFRSRRAQFAGWRELFLWRASLLGVLFAAVLGWYVAISMMQVNRLPHGGTDGWAIWNSHARYIVGGGATWKQGILNTYHPDYPLLLPGVIAHAWSFMGNALPDIAGYVGILFVLMIAAILTATLIRLRGPTIGLLMSFVLIGSPSYIFYAAAGYADVPLSAYVLSTVALICLYEAEATKPAGLVILAGFMAGCAAWTKNEGLPFVVIVSAILLVTVFHSPSTTLRRFAAFAAGAALPLATIAYFKLTIAPPNDVMGSLHSAELIAKVLDPNRYAIISRHFMSTGWTFGGWIFNPYLPILVFIGLCGIDRSVLQGFSWRAGVGILVMVLGGYFAIYVITPADLNDHLVSSLDRLMFHVWPGCLLMAGMAARNPLFERTG
jgi:hypothetical protein